MPFDLMKGQRSAQKSLGTEEGAKGEGKVRRRSRPRLLMTCYGIVTVAFWLSDTLPALSLAQAYSVLLPEVLDT